MKPGIRLVLIISLITLTGAAMTAAARFSGLTTNPAGASDRLSVSGKLVQDKVLVGSNQPVSLSLTLNAADILGPESDSPANSVDLVMVLDRSGSMNGDKIRYARQAVLNLLEQLGAEDRFALVSYSDEVRLESSLVPVTPANMARLQKTVSRIEPAGCTNLGAGLQEGLNLILADRDRRNAARLILISDGLANRGVTDVKTLSNMASVAVEREFSVSTVGVGADFNECLMTSLADRGAGRYYFLNNPAAFARTFENECRQTRLVAVSGISVHVPASDGVRLSHAAGYPIEYKDGEAVFYPGTLGSGQSRNLFLSFQIPTDSAAGFRIGPIAVGYMADGARHRIVLNPAFEIACIPDAEKVAASIQKDAWEKKVLQDDYGRLKEQVASDIKSGDREKAMDRIDAYRDRQSELNARVGSAAVNENLNQALPQLSRVVEETFKGEAEAVRRKQAVQSKALQYEGYKSTRSQE